MRSVRGLAIAVVGCSSAAPARTPAPEPTPRPPIDAAAPVAVTLPDAESVCVPYDATLIGVVDGALEMCAHIDADFTCYEVGPQGVEEVMPPRQRTMSNDDRTATICRDDGDCTTITPTLGKKQRVVEVDVDNADGRAAVALHDDAGGPAVVEVWSADQPRRLARGEVKVGKAAVELQDVALLGGFVLLIAERADGARPSWILRIDGERLSRVASLDDAPSDWAALDGESAAFVLGAELAVVSLASGQVERTVPWRELLDDPAAADEEPQLHVAGDGDAIGVLIEDDGSNPIGAGVIVGEVATRIGFRRCPYSEY